ncbi:MAG: peptidoglycan bridge formation glycyltransferase FemA/FemB family protein [Anaerolineae bacterium]|nr:peptidoglycan bridge formation glycyltransferase FemA/FemB family protein [Anaerolineae bacterium]
MSKLELLLDSEINSSEWDDFTRHAQYGHLLQSSLWGKLKEGFGWKASRILLLENGFPLAGAQILFRPLLPGLCKPVVAYVPRGPILPPEEGEISRVLLGAIHIRAREEGAIFLKIEPDWVEFSWPERIEEPSHCQHSIPLQKWGFIPARTIQPRSTIILDISVPEEEILSRMKHKTRYNIRLASRKGVRVRRGSTDDLPVFYALMEITSKRDRFGIHTCDYYRKALELFAPSGDAILLLAEYEGEVLAGLMAFKWGKRAFYMYGASSNFHRNLMPNHLLQWEAILWAKNAGCLTYDLWGIPDEVGQDPKRYWDEPPERHDGLWGVYRFKRGFGGNVVRYTGAWDYVYSPAWYTLYRLALKFLRP